MSAMGEGSPRTVRPWPRAPPPRGTTSPVGGGVEETGAMPTKVFFMAAAPALGGDEPVPGWAFNVLDEPAGGGELVVPVGGGVDPCGATPTSVLFIAAAAGEAAFIALDDGVGRGGL